MAAFEGERTAVLELAGVCGDEGRIGVELLSWLLVKIREGCGLVEEVRMQNGCR